MSKSQTHPPTNTANKSKSALIYLIGRHLFVAGLVASLLLHLSFMVASMLLPKQPSHTANITVELVEEKNLANSKTHLARQLVREATIPDKIKVEENNDPVKFLSRQTQRVQKQTRAALNGLTQNRNSVDNQTDNKTQEQAKPEQTTKDLAKNSGPSKDNGEILYPQKKSKKLIDAFTPQYKKVPTFAANQKLDRGVSTLGESLPNDVEVGSFTALNTDRYLYYSFFSRIEELIRFNWENMVRQSIDTTPADRFKSNVSGLWNTQLEIWLKPNGEFHSAHLLKESGFRGFDQAAVQAFVQARLFPNPPKEMVEDDGLIHLKYMFQVRYEPKVLVHNN